MNAEQIKQIQFNALWQIVKPVLLTILKQFGKEWLQKAWDELDGEDVEAKACPPGYVRNSNGDCVPDVG